MKNSTPITDDNDDAKVKEKATVLYPRMKYMHTFANEWNDPVYRNAATQKDERAQRALMRRILDPHITHLVLFNTNKTATASYKPHEHVRRALSNLGGVAKATVLMRGSDADTADVEQSMHAALPTVVMRDTGGTADGIAIMLNESLQSQAVRDRETRRQHATMPKPGTPGDFRADSQEEWLDALYARIEAGEAGQDDRQPLAKSKSRRKGLTEFEDETSVETDNPVFRHSDSDSDSDKGPSDIADKRLRDIVSQSFRSKRAHNKKIMLDPAFECWVKGGCVVYVSDNKPLFPAATFTVGLNHFLYRCSKIAIHRAKTTC
eukprot:COSAG01_NODE_1620_length_9713_cov_4.117433_6_plen_320_part_00